MTLMLNMLFPLLFTAADQASTLEPPAAPPIAREEAAPETPAPTPAPAPEPEPEIEVEIEATAPAGDTIDASAEAPAAPVVTTPLLSREDILADASDALEAISSAKGAFLQISPDGSTARGSFFLRRPGRIRFEYDDPTPLLIVADGATVAIEDRDLETVDRAPLSATPLDLFLKKRVDLANDGDVVDVRQVDGRFFIGLEDKTGEAEGRLILEFGEGDFSLDGWTTVDPAGGVTRVALLDVETDVRLPARLFVIEDPEDDEDRRR